MTIDTSREAVERLRRQLASKPDATRFDLTRKTVEALLAERDWAVQTCEAGAQQVDAALAEVARLSPADAQAALTAIERAAYERGVQSALQHIRTWMELEAEDRGEADAEYPLERQCAPILALLTQEGR